MIRRPPRFTLRQLFIGVAAIASLLATVFIYTHPWPTGRLYNQVSSVKFSPDGARLCVFFYSARDAGVPGKVYVKDVTRAIALLDVPGLSTFDIVEHDYRKGNQGPDLRPNLYRGTAFAPDGSFLYVLDRIQGQVRTWDIAGRRSLGERGITETEFSGLVLPTKGKRSVVVTNDGVQVWELGGQKPIRTFHEGQDVLDRVTCCALSPDGDTLAVRCGEGLRLYSVNVGDETVLLPEYFVVIRTSTGYGTKSRSGDTTRGIAFSPDGRALAAWGEYGLKFFNMTAGGKLLKSVSDTSILCLAFSPDGKSYATGHQNGKVALWDFATKSQTCSTTLRARDK